MTNRQPDLLSIVLDDLGERRDRLAADGALLSPADIDRHTMAFRDRFGPERLARLDGEDLLDVMHGRGRGNESLVYWLEFKNDEEFPSDYGSIAGGNAFKFEVYRRNRDGAWMTGSAAKPREISVAEAVQIARRQRKQLLNGVEALHGWAPYHTLYDDMCRDLQRDMEQAAGPLADAIWAHKYWALLFPGTLPSIHSAPVQRFHLVKLLDLPPQPLAGAASRTQRFISAGRFKVFAGLLDVPLPALGRVLRNRHGDRHRYWRVGTRDEDGHDAFPDMLADGHVSVGYPQVPDAGQFLATSEVGQVVRAHLHRASPGQAVLAVNSAASQFVAFARDMAEGDIVVAGDGQTVRAIGRVTGGYRHDPRIPWTHLRPVQWLDTAPWEMPEREARRTRCRELVHPAHLVEIERRLLLGAPQPPMPPRPPRPPADGGPDPVPPRPAPPPLDGILARIPGVLERKGQIILYGPPGTGKTHWALTAARELAARKAFGCAWKDATPAEREAIGGRPGKPGLVRLCTFHPSYGYEDFIEGLRPARGNAGALVFDPTPGLFKALCDEAADNPCRDFFLLIDEINRGDVPRIFGETLTLLELDKRGLPVLLPLRGDSFVVPPNVRIIGTMNTADRSIALLDAALRRRFGFLELMPDPQALGAAAVRGVSLAAWLGALNARLRDALGRDARNLQIGHAYLMERGVPVTDFAPFARILREDIIPLLEEHCYGDWNALAAILGTDFVDVREQRIRDQRFSPDGEADLVDAVRRMFPETATTPEAMRTQDDDEADDADDLDDAGG
ncbi:AAA family ATPase [Azospirillum brasilense]|uniref:AAA family ATPase n=1 Tax=Azospirillum brasilense TaxID=192 RepID=UPI001EDB8262|nr:AAA family ATPase [Azospirillum brasilense]UKJ75929.1 AAA family ATPase [Azospirillum brasilense]